MDAPLVIFDGTCGFCARSVRFVAARDAQRRFRFAPAGSTAAREALAPFGIDADAPGTVVLVEEGAAYVRSTAALRMARRLRWPWSWIGAALLLVPRPLRDAVYRVVAAVRHTKACSLRPAV